ncbi:hypothetical protein ZWY2020_019704 [Hordeum vulgare]|nr:hypothetical protein ZWY2020_019704 [Hordeum vulgare]
MEYEDESTEDNEITLGCSETVRTTKSEGADNYGFVEWVDPYWPIPMENALLKLWQMYEDAKASGSDNLNSA